MNHFVLHVQSDKPDLYLKLAKLLYEYGETDKAIQATAHAIQLNPKYIAAIVFLAEIYEAERRFDQVIDCYQKIVLLQPQNPVALAKIAGAMVRSGDLAGATQSYKAAISLPNPPVWAYLGLAQCFEKSNQLEEAILAYQAVIAIQPENSKFHLYLARLYAKKEDFLAQSLENYQRVLYLDSSLFLPVCSEIVALLKLYNKRQLIRTILPKLVESLLEIWLVLNQDLVKDLESVNEAISCVQDIEVSLATEVFELISEYRVMNLSALNDDDENFLNSIGISYKYLSLNATDVFPGECLDISSQFKEKDEVGFPHQVEELREKVSFQFGAVKNGIIYLLCPSKGNLIRSNRSFFIDNSIGGTICYRFIGEQVFYLFLGSPRDGFAKECLYFPNHNLVISFSGSLYKLDKLNVLKAHMVLSCKKTRSYLNNFEKPRKAIILQVSHFAHHLWNELSAIHYFYTIEQLHRNVDKVLVLAEPLGPLEAIFPEIPPEQIERVDSDYIFDKILEENYFVIQLGFNFIQEKLAERLKKMAFKVCHANFLREIEELRNDHFPLIWISLRLQDRAWISIGEGIKNIAQELVQVFPKLGIVLDGITLPFGRDDLSYLKRLVDKEQEVADEISVSLSPTVKVFNSIGCMMYESIALAHLVDLYIAHHGSLQHKIGWVANKPGIIHTNQFLSKIDILEHQTVWGRENAVVPIKVSGYFIDAPESGRQTARSENYECDWHALSAEALKLCLSLRDTTEG